jgi:hypothetical protein
MGDFCRRAVLKANSIRICGDHLVKVKTQANTVQHPFPGYDEVFASLASGKKFPTVDFCSAFWHVKVSAATAEILTLNTHKGLLRPRCQQFGVHSAPAIWQKFVDSIFKDIECAVVHDDIIII